MKLYAIFCLTFQSPILQKTLEDPLFLIILLTTISRVFNGFLEIQVLDNEVKQLYGNSIPHTGGRRRGGCKHDVLVELIL